MVTAAIQFSETAREVVKEKEYILFNAQRLDDLFGECRGSIAPYELLKTHAMYLEDLIMFFTGAMKSHDTCWLTTGQLAERGEASALDEPSRMGRMENDYLDIDMCRHIHASYAPFSVLLLLGYQIPQPRWNPERIRYSMLLFLNKMLFLNCCHPSLKPVIEANLRQNWKSIAEGTDMLGKFQREQEIRFLARIIKVLGFDYATFERAIGFGSLGAYACGFYRLAGRKGAAVLCLGNV